jgi:hypothetical protein
MIKISIVVFIAAMIIFFIRVYYSIIIRKGKDKLASEIFTAFLIQFISPSIMFPILRDGSDAEESKLIRRYNLLTYVFYGLIAVAIFLAYISQNPEAKI